MLIHSHEGEDTILLVSNEVADALEQFVREGNNVALRRYRAKAYYSLDCGDGNEHISSSGRKHPKNSMKKS